MELTFILIAVACLIVGLAVGSLLTRTFSPQEKKRKALEEKLQQKEDELKIFQRDVAEHFMKSSEIVRELTRSQRDICEHLATGALRLTSPEVSRKVQDVAFEGLGADQKPRILSSITAEPPKDYAPSVPGGVLNESYGLTDVPLMRPVIDEDSDTNKKKQAKEKPVIDQELDDPTLNIS